MGFLFFLKLSELKSFPVFLLTTRTCENIAVLRMADDQILWGSN